MPKFWEEGWTPGKKQVSLSYNQKDSIYDGDK
jgi:hypothetical protein